MVLVLVRRRSGTASAAAAFGLAAMAGLITSGAGFAVDAAASSGQWALLVTELAFALVGVAVILLGSAEARAIAGATLGLLALWAGLLYFPALRHGVVLSPFPTGMARTRRSDDLVGGGGDHPWARCHLRYFQTVKG